MELKSGQAGCRWHPRSVSQGNVVARGPWVDNNKRGDGCNRRHVPSPMDNERTEDDHAYEHQLL